MWDQRVWLRPIKQFKGEGEGEHDYSDHVLWLLLEAEKRGNGGWWGGGGPWKGDQEEMESRRESAF